MSEVAASALQNRARAQQSRPAISPKDLQVILYHFPLRWAAMLLGKRFLPIATPLVEAASRVVRAHEFRTTRKNMMRFLGISAPQAKTLSDRFLVHQTHRALFELSLLAQKGSIPVQARIAGQHHLDRAVEQKRGVLLLSMHLCANRQAKFALRQMGYRILTVQRRGESSEHGRLGVRLVTRMGVEIQRHVNPDVAYADDPDAVLQVARELRGGGVVHIAVDARLSQSAMTVPFLKSTRKFSAGALDIARLTGCTVLPYKCVYDSPGIRIEFGEPLPIQTGGSAEEFRRANMPILMTVMEQHILSAPDQWDSWVFSNQ